MDTIGTQLQAPIYAGQAKPAVESAPAEEKGKAPAEQFTKSADSQDDFFSVKNRVKRFFKHNFYYPLETGGKLMAATGGIGTVAGAGGALLMGGPVLAAAAGGGAIGVVAGYAFTRWLSQKLF